MKILELEVEGYRSLKSVKWAPGDLNVLIGPNGSGKTNLLRAMQLLTRSAQGRLEKSVKEEGGMASLLWGGSTDELRLRVETMPPLGDLKGKARSLSYELVLDNWPDHYAIDETLEATPVDAAPTGEAAGFALLQRTLGKTVVRDKDGGLTRIDEEGVPLSETILSTATGPFAFDFTTRQFRRALSEWSSYYPLKTELDSPVRRPPLARHELFLAEDGENLVSVLHTRYSDQRDFKVRLDAAMKAAFGDDFEELTFSPVWEMRIQMGVRWRGLKRPISASYLSDGTLRFLFLLAVLMNPEQVPFLAIEEPELGLHPSMLPIIAEFAVEASSRSQIVFATHSADFLSAFRDVTPTTTVFGWENGQTVLRVLSGPELDYWLKDYSLGELFRSGQLESME